MLPFAGAARPLAPSDIAAAAREMGVREEAVTAVMTVETGGVGGFLSDKSGRPRILFESKAFGDHTRTPFRRFPSSYQRPRGQLEALQGRRRRI